MSLGVEQNESPDPVHVTLFSAYAVMLAAQHIAHLVQEPRLGGGLRRRKRPIWSLHANRDFARAVSVPCPNNELIGLKNDKDRRRIEVFDTVFRRSTSSYASRGVKA